MKVLQALNYTLTSSIYVVNYFCFWNSGFKQDLYGYLLEYTSNLLQMIVNARDKDPDAKELIDLVKKHNSGEGDLGDFSDENVSLSLTPSCLSNF